MLQREIGIDLGTVNVLVYVRGAGIVLQEPSVVALTVNESRIVAVGEEAKSMLGRTPDAIEVVRPMRDGVIADYQITEAMLRYFIKKATGGVRMFKPKVMISVPFGVTSVESRAVHEAAVAAGGATRDVHLIPEPIAAAIGAGMPVNTPTGNMVLDLGGGTTEAAVVSMNGIVVANSVRVGGVRMDEAIVAYIRKKYSLAIGEPTAEEIKFRLGAAIPLDEEFECAKPFGTEILQAIARTDRFERLSTVEVDGFLQIKDDLATALGVTRGIRPSGKKPLVAESRLVLTTVGR